MRRRGSRTVSDHLSQSLAVVWILGHWLAVMERLASPIVHRQLQVVSRDGACHRVSEGLDTIYGGTGCGMLEDDPEFREGLVK